MGRYISFTAEYGDHQASSAVFRGLLSETPFRPCGLAAIDIKESRTRWFLSGFGLEHFVARFSSAATTKAPVITVCDSVTSADHREYMVRLSAWINGNHHPKEELAPNETFDVAYGTTFLTAPTLPESAIDSYDKWASLSAKSAAVLYGTFDLSVREPGRNDWTKAFRFALPTLDSGCSLPGAPFVSIDAHRRVPESIMGPLSIMVFSASTAWLHDSRAIQGHISNDCADLNLAKLANVASVLSSSEWKPHHTTLSVESQTFRRDYDRIESAFAQLIV